MPAKKKTTEPKKDTTMRAPKGGGKVATLTMKGTFIVPIDDGKDPAAVCQPIKDAAQNFAQTLSDQPGVPTCALMFSMGMEVEDLPGADDDGDDGKADAPADEEAQDERAQQIDRLKSAVGLSDAEAERLINIIRGE